MRIIVQALIGASLAACNHNGFVVRGSLSDEECRESPGQRVFLEGTEVNSEIENCRLTLSVQDSGALVLVFGDEEGEEAWMHLDRVPARGELRLTDIWFDDRNLAFPAEVRLEGADVIALNGLRIGNADRLPRRVAEDATVLGVSSGGDWLLLRPGNERLPDLRVRVDSTTRVISTDGRPSSLSSLAFGDPVRLSGETGDGLVLANEIRVPVSEARGSRRGSTIWSEAERVLEALERQVTGGARRPVRADDEDSDGDSDKKRSKGRSDHRT